MLTPAPARRDILCGVIDTGGGAETDVRSTEIDGVPAFWLPVEGSLTVQLLFRVGRADEQLAEGGITHLVEHLSLYSLGARSVRYHFNGYVDAVTTAFHAQGSAEDVVSFVADVCSALGDLPLARLDAEKEILRSEAGQHQPGGALDSLLRWRHGARTYGLSAYEQFGLYGLDGAAVASWARRWFTRGNAALWMTGEPPPALRLSLPDGQRSRPPEASSALPATPAWYAEGGGGAAMLTDLPRSSAGVMLRNALEQRLMTRLRYELGASYSPQVGYERRTGVDAAIWVLADAVEGREQSVSTELASALGAIAEAGCKDEDLRHWRRRMEDAAADPGAGREFLHVRCWDHLQGGEERSYAETLEELRAVDSEQVAAAAGIAAQAALYRLPEGTAAPAPPVVAAPVWSARTVQGLRFDAIRASADEPLTTMVVGPDGLMLDRPDGNQVTVPWADCEALLCWPDGRRAMLSADGFVMELLPNVWIDGDELRRRVDEGVARQRHVPMPAMPPDQFPFPAPPGEPDNAWWAVILLATVVLTLLGIMVVDRTWDPVFLLLLFPYFLYRRVRVLRETRRARGLSKFPRWSSSQTSSTSSDEPR